MPSILYQTLVPSHQPPTRWWNLRLQIRGVGVLKRFGKFHLQKYILNISAGIGKNVVLVQGGGGTALR